MRRRTALVVGGGLAGTAVARSLAVRGVEVTLIEARGIAAGASGNALAVLMPLINGASDALSRLHLLGVTATLDEIRRFAEVGSPIPGRRCAAIRFPRRERDFNRAIEAIAAHRLSSCQARPIAADTATKIVGLPIDRRGVLFAEAGVWSPAALCRARILEGGEFVRVQTRNVGRIEAHLDRHIAYDDEGLAIAEGDLVVLAEGADAGPLLEKPLALRRVRGQLATVTPTESSLALRVILAGSATITPAVRLDHERRHLIAATFSPDDDETTPRQSDHDMLLDRVIATTPALRDAIVPWSTHYDPRVSWRAATDDRLPCVGEIRRGWYVTSAHASRGLATSGIAGEFVADLAMGVETPSLPADLITAISPLRPVALRRVDRA